MSVVGRSFTKAVFRSFSKISKESVYFEAVRDLRKLDTFNRDKILHETYALSLTSLIAFSFEQYVTLCMDPSKKEIRFLLMRDRRFNSLIGYSFYPIHELHLNPNDSSHGNKFLASLSYNFLIQPNFRCHAGLKMYDISELLIKHDYPNYNRLAFNTTMNTIFYEHRAKLTDLLTPNPLKPANAKLDHLMERLIEDLNHPRTPGHPLIRIYPGAYLVGVDYTNPPKNLEKASQLKKFFLEVTQSRPEWAMFNVAVFNLVKDNTAGLPAGEHSKFQIPDFDVFEFGTRKPINLIS